MSRMNWVRRRREYQAAMEKIAVFDAASRFYGEQRLDELSFFEARTKISKYCRGLDAKYYNEVFDHLRLLRVNFEAAKTNMSVYDRLEPEFRKELQKGHWK